MLKTSEPARNGLFTKLGVTAFAAIFALTACGESAAGDSGSDDDAGTETSSDDHGEDSGAAEASGEPIQITGVPAEDASALESKFDLLLEIVESETGRPAEFNHSTDYNAVIEALVAGQADLAVGSPFTYVRAGDAGADVDVLGGRIEEEGEEAGYVSYALVPPDSDIETLEDAEGRDVCYVEQGSTSGFLYPSAGMLDAGLEPQDDVNAHFPGSHDGAVLAMMDGQCDLAFAYDSMVEVLMPSREELSEEDYEVIWESPMIPASPIFMNEGTLDEATQDSLRSMFEDNLINIDSLVEAGYCEEATPEGCGLPEDSYEYTPVDDGIYDGIREVCEITQAEACD